MALRETARQCNIFVLFQSHLVYVGLIGPLPQLSSFLYRYVSFLLHLPYAFKVLAIIPSFTRMFIGFGFITGSSYWRSYWQRYSLSFSFLLWSRLVLLLLSALFEERSSMCLVLALDLDWTSARESSAKLQLIRAELSSNGSSEPPSELHFPS